MRPWSMCAIPGVSRPRRSPTSATWPLVGICAWVNFYSNGLELLNTPWLGAICTPISPSFPRAGVRKKEINSPKQMQNTVWYLTHVSFCSYPPSLWLPRSSLLGVDRQCHGLAHVPGLSPQVLKEPPHVYDALQLLQVAQRWAQWLTFEESELHNQIFYAYTSTNAKPMICGDNSESTM